MGKRKVPPGEIIPFELSSRRRINIAPESVTLEPGKAVFFLGTKKLMRGFSFCLLLFIGFSLMIPLVRVFSTSRSVFLP